MNLPKGIINIITDYAHTLFYIDELKDKTYNLFVFTPYVYDNYVVYFGSKFLGWKYKISKESYGWVSHFC